MVVMVKQPNHTFILLLLFTLISASASASASATPVVTRFQQYLRINTAHPHPDYSTAVSFLDGLAKSIPIPNLLHTRTLYLTTPQKPLLLVTLPGSNPSLPSILLNSHLDSVPTEPSKWSHPPFSAVRTHDGNIFARGAQDDKCIAIQYLEAIRNILHKDPGFRPIRTLHICYVPDEEIGGLDGMARFVESQEFRDMNVGFFLDEGHASLNDEYWVFYADRSPWNLVIKATGQPGHGSRMFDNSAMENLMKSVEPSEAEAGYDVRLPPTVDPDLLKKRIADEWAPATRNVSYHIVEKGPLRDYMGRPLITTTNDSNPWWTVFKHAVEACGGKLSKPEILASTTDARYMRFRGIPTFGFSPMKNTPILLHDHNEFLKDTVLLEGIKVYEIKALTSFEGAHLLNNDQFPGILFEFHISMYE
ncbi:hypothetical protein SSX86_008220 [Deinandra increscens subsp. villosa]|uniref:N-acyl-L-amino-acid amidohydrolase n=1 Tax=Deinandra increscens subsp. villosa TaxID=3103831 RepID=A0AAP0H4B7_9ASTR